MSNVEIDAIVTIGTAYADAVHAEASARIEREQVEADIVSSLLGNDNPLTGKPHSVSSASEFAKTCDAVIALRRGILDRERETIILRARYEAMKINCWSDVRLAGVA